MHPVPERAPEVPPLGRDPGPTLGAGRPVVRGQRGVMPVGGAPWPPIALLLAQRLQSQLPVRLLSGLLRHVW